MAQRSRRTKLNDLAIMTTVGTILYVLYETSLPLAVWILLAIAALTGWISLLMPTYCDVETVRGGPCRRGVYGKLRACQPHARDKRDAVFAYLNLRNPGLLFRQVWPTTTYRPGRSGDTSHSVDRTSETRRRTAYDVAMFVVAFVSAVAGIVGAVGSILALG